MLIDPGSPEDKVNVDRLIYGTTLVSYLRLEHLMTASCLRTKE